MTASDDTAEQIAARLDDILRRQRRAAKADVEGLTHGRFRVLRTLDQADRPLRLSELATQLGIVPRSATSVVDDLEAGGLLARQPDPHDRRATLVALTPAGADLLATVRRNRRDAMVTLLDRLTPDEQSTLLSLLNRLADD
ncbi:MarR family winged helix-turn-helix transcriptional regulator [Kribbella sp. NPDC056951]|uniref:MarR family winged helix-turn-helix transcriptional regulator n=1 Tax=Kribbella sp. NPDC056951 TaxID=3345978 RepID=UPI003629D588